MQQGQRLAAAKDGAGNVDIDQVSHLVIGRFGQCERHEHTGIVDQCVNVRKAPGNCGEGFAHLVRIGDVAGQREVRGAKFCGHCLDFGECASEQDDSLAIACKSPGERAAKTISGPGDDDCPAHFALRKVHRCQNHTVGWRCVTGRPLV